MTRPLIFMDPFPRTEEMVYTPETVTALDQLGDVVSHFGSRAPDALVEEVLPRVEIIIGQTAMPRERLDRAPHLRAILNVKANWEPNIDYGEAQARGIHVLSAAPSMAPAVAEFCIGQAIALTRGLPEADRLFRSGKESYGIKGARQHYGLLGTRVGLIGFGNLGRELVPLLRPFGGEMLVHDPWLSDEYLRLEGLVPSSLTDLLTSARVIFVLAGVTTENEGFLDRRKLELVQPDASLILASRAEVVDFETLIELGDSGRIRVAIDVFPQEPVPDDHPCRHSRNILFSAHIAGAMKASYARIRSAMLDDTTQILKGFPPMRMQQAVPRLAEISCSR
ncbi:MAG: hydroxyacid dehydrogenase [Alphaproteobacteria bacterium]|nr:hydroxyacid dehydrogenase [Alphaproteobacteria bacterium]